MAEAPHAPPQSDEDLWHTMNRATRDELQAEDSEAWKNVVGVLLFIVVIGLLLAVLTLYISAN